MSIKNREYTFGTNSFNKPNVLNGQQAVAARLMTLMMMEPGDDPLHPDMGVGLRTKFRYRVGENSLSELSERVEQQNLTYLPFYQNVNVSIIRTPDKICNIEISLGDTTYIYDSSATDNPILLKDIQS